MPTTGSSPLRRLPEALKSALGRMKAHDVGELAGGVAFRVFLAIFPALIAAVAFLGLVLSPEDIRALAADPPPVIPAEAVTLLQQPLEDLTEAGAGTGLLAVAGVLGGLWAASSAAAALIKALDRIHGVSAPRPFVRQRAVALAITLALVTALAVVMVLLVAGPLLRDLLLPAALAATRLRWVVTAAQVLAAAGVLLGLISFVYWLAPNGERGRLGWASPGAVVGVAGWLVLSAGFTLYVQTAGNYNATYGALAGVVVLLVWLQLSITVLLVGAAVDAEARRLVGLDEALSADPGADPLEPVAELLSPTVAATPLRHQAPRHQAPRPSGARLGAVAAGLATGVAAVWSVVRKRRTASG